MPTKFQLFRQKFINNFIMHREIKNKVVEKNLKLLFKVSVSLFALCSVAFVFTLLGSDVQNVAEVDYIVFYFLMSVVALFSAILSICFLKIKIISKSLYNIPVIINFVGLEVVCFVVFTYGVNTFNSMIIFVCIATLIPLIYAIEPLYYIIIMFFMGSLMVPRINELYGFDAVQNSIVYLLIMCGLAMRRWFSTNKNMVHDRKVEEWEKQIQQELEMSALVQKSFYQHNLSGVKDWNVAYYNDPMLSLSGDLFDFFIRQNNLAGLCIFDVSGHGLASGLVTMMVKNTMEEEFYENEDVELDFTMRRINERVSVEKGNIENYLTGIILRFGKNGLEMVNAGHPRPIIYHAATDTCEYFDCNVEDIQGAIGLGDFNYEFKTLLVNLEVDDRIILYTDGVTEAKNFLNVEYGEERFLYSVQNHRGLDVQGQIEAVVGDIKHYIGSSPRTDDISVIIIEKK